MTYRHIDAVHRLSLKIGAALIYDGVDCDCCLSCLTVADNQLSLSSANGDHRVNRLEAGLQRLGNRLTENHSGGLSLQWHLESLALYLSQAVERRAYGIHYPAHQRVIDPYGRYSGQPSDPHTFLHQVGRAEKHRSHIILLEVHSHCLDPAFELQKLSGFDIDESENPGHSITYRKSVSNFLVLEGSVDSTQLVEQQF